MPLEVFKEDLDERVAVDNPSAGAGERSASGSCLASKAMEDWRRDRMGSTMVCEIAFAGAIAGEQNRCIPAGIVRGSARISRTDMMIRPN